MEWTENKTKLLIEVEKHPCLYMFWQFIAYVIVQLLKQFYCARKLRHKLPQFIAVCVIALRAMTHTAINCGNIMAQLSCAIILPVCHSYLR